MKNNSKHKIFFFISFKKFTIIALDEFNEIILKKELLLKSAAEKFDFALFDTFINQNIFKIEKELNEFIKIIYLIIDYDGIFSVNLSIKNKVNKVFLNNDLINNLLIEAKSCCKETLKKATVLHMTIDQFYIDSYIYKTLPKNIRCENLCVGLSFVCIPSNFLQNFEKIFKKYQISIGKTLSYGYVNNFIEVSSNDLGSVCKKILSGINENEVILTNKLPKNLGFFEKFFNFFN
tara:strand:+ start:1206 stop:1907 length:702 start_codon:yes stop_codon:yes gene_type:complete